MSLITFTSDYGLSDHYAAKMKALIIAKAPISRILDISHTVKPFDIGQLSYVIRSVFKEFPEGTVHLVGGEPSRKGKGILACFIEGYWFVVPDNGLVTLLSEQPLHQVFEVVLEKANYMRTLAETAARLSSGEPIEGIGKPITDYQQFTSRKARATKKEIAGHIIYEDHYGNLITNIEKIDFDILSKNRTYTVHFGRERLNKVHESISDVDAGDVFFIFNSENKLMLGVSQGNGKELLGLQYDSPIIIKFEE